MGAAGILAYGTGLVILETILAGGDFMTDILIVEDDKERADLLTDFLREEGYVVSLKL